MASIGIGTIASSALQAKGLQLIENIVNANVRYGLFTENGNQFYEEDTASESQTSGSTTLGGKLIDAVSGALKTAKKTFFKSNLAVVGVTNINYSITSTITTAPLMKGNFFPYNKVFDPIQAEITYVTTGTEDQREYFENIIKSYQRSFRLLTLYSDNIFIKNVNIVSYSVNRSPKSQQMYNITIHVQEVMQKANSDGGLPSLESAFESLGDATAGSGTATETGQLSTSTPTASQIQSAKKVA